LSGSAGNLAGFLIAGILFYRHLLQAG